MKVTIAQREYPLIRGLAGLLTSATTSSASAEINRTSVAVTNHPS
jgi:hypothetical protein